MKQQHYLTIAGVLTVGANNKLRPVVGRRISGKDVELLFLHSNSGHVHKTAGKDLGSPSAIHFSVAPTNLHAKELLSQWRVKRSASVNHQAEAARAAGTAPVYI